MKTVTTKNVIYSMARSNEPAARVRPNEKFTVLTKDAYSNTIKTKKDRFTEDKWPVVNPATGPVFVESAEPPNVLAVRIHRIEVPAQGAMYIDPDQGALARHIPKPETAIYKIAGGKMTFDAGLKLAVRPMIGVIGTAPRGRPILNGTPGEHGGNLDCKHITAGTVVYLPINKPGALLAMGDVHALMADGEAVICGLETRARITCSADVVDPVVVTPAVQTPDRLMILASGKTLDRAERLVLDKAVAFLTETVGLPLGTSVRLLSLVGDLAVCQVVDPFKTMRVELPLKVLRAYGWKPPAAFK